MFRDMGKIQQLKVVVLICFLRLCYTSYVRVYVNCLSELPLFHPLLHMSNCKHILYLFRQWRAFIRVSAWTSQYQTARLGCLRGRG